jgi:hypothetical protein
MTAPTRPAILVLSTVFLLLAVFLVSVVLAATLVPILPCPGGCPPRADLSPCSDCNGFGRTPLMQYWYHLQFDQQREQNFRNMQM